MNNNNNGQLTLLQLQQKVQVLEILNSNLTTNLRTIGMPSIEIQLLSVTPPPVYAAQRAAALAAIAAQAHAAHPAHGAAGQPGPAGNGGQAAGQPSDPS